MTKADRIEILPRGLGEDDAAAYVGVSAPLFRQAVRDGRMPTPIPFGRRLVWDLKALDDAFDRLGGRRSDIPDRATRLAAEREKKQANELDAAIARRHSQG